MAKVILTKGLPGSGKSTWAKAFVEKNPNYVRINRDDLRNMRGKYWMPKHEDFISKWQQSLIKIALQNSYSVVIDDTNLNKKWINQLLEIIGKEHQVEWKDFTDVPLQTCIERDLKRANSVGEKVIVQMYEKYILQPQHVNQNSNLPHCAIFDIDGTLALFGNKNPFERDFINDDVNLSVKIIYENYPHNLVVFSGRSDRFKKVTKEWLEKSLVKFPVLFEMRTEQEEKDKIKDVIVKQRLFDTFIKDKFYVDFVVDDRPQVIRLWKQLGLNVFNVGDGYEF